jgi:hypothetical protein
MALADLLEEVAETGLLILILLYIVCYALQQLMEY